MLQTVTRLLAQQDPSQEADWTINAIPVLLALAGALLLFGIIRFVRGLTPRLPLPRVWHERFARSGPIIELFAWSIYVAISIAWLFEGNSVATIVLLAALVVMVVVAAFFAIRDYLTGVIVRVERFARVGDLIKVPDRGVGEVTNLGTRFAEIELPNGDVVLMPYGEVGRKSVVRTQRGRNAPRHSFVVALPAGVPSARAQSVAYNAALLSHWAAPKYDPRVRAVDGATLEVTVQPIVALRSDDLELAVRQALAALVESS